MTIDDVQIDKIFKCDRFGSGTNKTLRVKFFVGHKYDRKSPNRFPFRSKKMICQKNITKFGITLAKPQIANLLTNWFLKKTI